MDKLSTRITENFTSEMLWQLDAIISDVTFIYDCSNDNAILYRFINEKCDEPVVMETFSKDMLERAHPDDLLVLEQIVARSGHYEQKMDFEIRIKESDGRRYRWHSVHIRHREDGKGHYYIGTSTFIDSRETRELQTIKSRQDALTGLLNRTALSDNITAFLNQNPQSCNAMIVFDLDGFKNFNGVFGTLFGDEVIKDVTARIRRVFEEDSFIGRIGGDQFLIFVKNVDSIGNLSIRMNRLRDMLMDVRMGQRNSLDITSSSGIALHPEMGATYEQLFTKAYMAMTHVKNHGRNSFAFYTDEYYNETLGKKNPAELGDFLSTNENACLSNFAFRLLADATDVNRVLNLLMYRIQTDYDTLAILIDEFSINESKGQTIRELVTDSKFSQLGTAREFSYTAFEVKTNAFNANGGYLVYDTSGNEDYSIYTRLGSFPEVKSVLHINMVFLSEPRGCVELASSHEADFWTEDKIQELRKVVQLVTVTEYYANRAENAETQVRKLAECDSLTGFYKEEAFIKIAGRAIQTKTKTRKLAVVYSDVAEFKYINEKYGYAVGDKLLTEVSTFLNEHGIGVLCAGRFYSDNFLFLAEFERGLSDNEITDSIDLFFQKMAIYLGNAIGIAQVIMKTGVYVIQDVKTDPAIAVSNANMARKAAKKVSSVNTVLFDSNMMAKHNRAIDYRNRMKSAIANKEFFVMLQPKVSGEECKVVGAEALVRWRGADNKMIFPDEFIPAFEEDGSIVKLDFYVYECTMKYLNDRIKSGKKVVPISMNMSRVHLLQSEFAPKFKQLMNKYEIPAELLELEITESIYLENLSASEKMIDEIRKIGVKISMDDFGSGYSSLNALNDLRFDVLKIDRIFMKDDNLRESDKTIVRFIIDMARSLNVSVLCEGVETNAQRVFLNEAGCDMHQGYFYSKPVEMSAFDEILENEGVLFEKIKQ